MRRTSWILKIIFFAGFAASFSVPLNATEYLYSPVQSKVLFTIKHMGMVTLSGAFKDFSGAFSFDPAAIEKVTVAIRIDTASIDSGVSAFDRRLKSKNFFWSDKFPQITFVSREVQDVADNRFKILGDLTIKGITRPVTFHTQWNGTVEASPGDKQPVFDSFAIIERKDFNLGGIGKVLDFVAREELKIQLQIQGVPKNGLVSFKR